MPMFDTVQDTPQGYDDQLKCWDCEMTMFGVGDTVPSVEGHTTYSVRLNTFKELPARYLTIAESILTHVCAEAPIQDQPVFDKWGRALTAPSFLGEESPFVQALQDRDRIRES